MTDILSWGVSSLTIAATLGALGWLAGRRHAPATAHALFVLALLKLITPPLFTFGLLASPTIELAPGAALRTAADLFTPSSTPPAVHDTTTDWPSWLALAWITGAVASLALATMRMWALDRRIAAMHPAAEPIQRELCDLAQRLGMRRAPRAVVVEANISPMVCPTLRGLHIVLPARLLAQLSPAARETLLVHELAHVRRLDWLVRFVEVAAIAAWWWMPLVYVLRRELRNAEERCCDAWVATELPDSTHCYAEALVATTALVERVPATACGLGPIQELEQRIHMLHQPASRSLGHVGRSAILILALGLLPVVACRGPAHVTVLGVDSHSGEAFLMGAVTTTTPIDIAAGTDTLLEAVSTAALASNADLSRVVLIRPDTQQPLTIVADIGQMLTTGNTEHNVPLQPSDIVYVPAQFEPAPSAVSRVAQPRVNKSTIEQGDIVHCLVEPSVAERSGMELLQELRRPQRIGKEGTILVPFVGSLKLNGLTTAAATKLINERLGEFFAIDTQVQVCASESNR